MRANAARLAFGGCRSPASIALATANCRCSNRPKGAILPPNLLESGECQTKPIVWCYQRSEQQQHAALVGSQNMKSYIAAAVAAISVATSAQAQTDPHSSPGSLQTQQPNYAQASPPPLPWSFPTPAPWTMP